MKCKSVCLNLSTNLNRYKIEVIGCNEYCSKIINNRQNCLPLTSKSDKILVILSPIDSEYYSKLYLRLDLTGQTCFNVSYNFLRRVNQDLGRYTFILTDRNYGLKIDGILTFNQV